MIRTRTRDGGGAYLLLDGSRPMTGNLNLGGNKLVGDSISGGNLTLESTSHASKGNIIFKDVLRPGDSELTNIGTTSFRVGSMWVKVIERLFTINARNNFKIRPLATAATQYQLQSHNGAAFVVVMTFVGGNVRMANLPLADPADGNSQLWNNGGVVTVGT